MAAERASKPSVPSRLRINIDFETTTPTEPWILRTTRARETLRESKFRGSEADLIRTASEALRTTPEAFCRDAAIHLARRTLSRGLAANDRPARLETAYRDLAKSNAAALAAGGAERPITPTTLRSRAIELYPEMPQISFRTAKRWLETSHGSGETH